MDRENAEVLGEDGHLDSGKSEVVNPDTRPESLIYWLVEFFIRDGGGKLSSKIVCSSQVHDVLVHRLVTHLE